MRLELIMKMIFSKVRHRHGPPTGVENPDPQLNDERRIPLTTTLRTFPVFPEQREKHCRLGRKHYVQAGA